MSDDADKIKLELPSKLQAFSFTFETKRPGSMTVEITLRRPTKRPRLLQFPEHVDLSATEPETPDRLQVMRWQEAQKYKLPPGPREGARDPEDSLPENGGDALYGTAFDVPAPAALRLHQPEAVD
ncbi:hypothetical protein DFJ58DRAFT_842339 [Suillus subalutaceus]|uniref:uncharacterized protein n=1 Tax=Suillus subalutaceus TaxID=48586 RepID=UPI001B87EF88|nr:uncharacterized protein DFJ58DRAFT_842339 [Suillus subalutaceus]KAG1850841.1 hypothetical protein DFJ58DRAFT_842339 [Suillus subalutaceus]